MRCQKCGSYNIGCKDSRESRSHPGRRHRRQKCKDCGATWATIEINLEEYQELTASRATMDGLRKMKQRAAAALLSYENIPDPGLPNLAVKKVLRYVLGMEDPTNGQENQAPPAQI